MYNTNMRFHVRPFRRLQWQLSLSYTLVAAGALLVVELVLFGALLALVNSDALPRLMIRSFRQQFVMNLLPYLDKPQPDVKGLRDYMAAYARLGSQDQNVAIPARVNEQNLVVVDANGNLLWSQYPIAGAELGKPLDLNLVPGLSQVLPAALANDPEDSHLYGRADNFLVLAVPISGAETSGPSGQRAVGVLIFQFNMPTLANPSFYLQLLPTILVSLLVFTVGSGLVGSVFGYFTARRLTRRLAQVSLAADAWSHGDFSTFIRDAADDELGELARRLNAMAEQLQNLMDTRRELAAVEERNRIARDLHDSVKQQVFATAMQLGAARALLPDETSPTAQRLAEAERLTKQAQNELTALIRQLRPVALEGKGLARALRELASDWSQQSGISVQFNAQAEAAGAPLPALKEQALYRVAQEALANIARHSQASSVQVSYERFNGQARLVIADDGKGFDLDTAQGKGLGLKSMRERIEALEGKLEIESAPGKGTRVEFFMPV